MAKSKREQFEDQLRDLQKDISVLSQKLSTPTLTSASTRYSNDFKTYNSSQSVLNNSHTSSQHGSNSSHNHSVPSHHLNHSHHPHASESSVLIQDGKQYELISNQLKSAVKNCEDTQRQLDLARYEIEEMKKGIADHALLKSEFDRLRQENESLKISLESSERIRSQQKELISVLQKANSMMSEASVVSFNSLSTISHKGDLATPSIISENKEWLNINSQSNKSTSLHQKDIVNNSSITKAKSSSIPTSSFMKKSKTVSNKLSSRPRKPLSTPSTSSYNKQKSKPNHKKDQMAKQKQGKNHVNNGNIISIKPSYLVNQSSTNNPHLSHHSIVHHIPTPNRPPLYPYPSLAPSNQSITSISKLESSFATPQAAELSYQKVIEKIDRSTNDILAPSSPVKASSTPKPTLSAKKVSRNAISHNPIETSRSVPGSTRKTSVVKKNMMSAHQRPKSNPVKPSSFGTSHRVL